MEKEKILIIGAAQTQLQIIRIAKQEGYYVIAVSPNPEEPGAKEADEHFLCDIFDIDRLVDMARERGIRGVLTDQSDKATPVVAQIAERLDLPGIGYENAIYFTDKSKMRELFIRIGLPVAPNETVDTLQAALSAAGRIGYPAVIKPVDSFASRGVHIVTDAEELADRFSDSLGVSSCKKVIVERYIRGPQFFSQGYVQEGHLTLFAFSDRYYFDVPDVCLPYTNAFPAKIDSTLQNRMTADFSCVIDVMRPAYGQVWAEWIYDEEGDVLYLIEMACRGAGAMVTTDVIPNAYGFDTQRFLVHDAMGHHRDWFDGLKIQHDAAAFYCFLVPPGKVLSVEGLDRIDAIKGVVSYQMRPIRVGDVLPPYKDKSSRFGPIVIKGKNRDELDKIREQLIKTIQIKVDTGSGIAAAVWE